MTKRNDPFDALDAFVYRSDFELLDYEAQTAIESIVTQYGIDELRTRMRARGYPEGWQRVFESAARHVAARGE